MVINEVKVEAVSQTKKGIKINGNWVNADRSVGKFENLSKDTIITDVELSDDGKWVKSYKVKSSGGGQFTSANPMNGADRDAKITRGNAANAAFGPAFTALMADGKLGPDEALAKALDITESVAQYIAEGN